ncbi:unnamed protein product [Trichobilharzia regenti]|nr:unnamed protein product [Trichobilharzia regenti]
MLLSILLAIYLICIDDNESNATNVKYLYWHADGKHGVDIESNFDFGKMVKERMYASRRRPRKHGYAYKKKLSSKLLSAEFSGEDSSDTDKKVLNVDNKQSESHQHGTSIVITHNMYSTTLDGKTKTDEEGSFREEDYGENDPIPSIVKHPTEESDLALPKFSDLIGELF